MHRIKYLTKKFQDTNHVPKITSNSISDCLLATKKYVALEVEKFLSSLRIAVQTGLKSVLQSSFSRPMSSFSKNVLSHFEICITDVLLITSNFITALYQNVFCYLFFDKIQKMRIPDECNPNLKSS